jgi:hypothetical protein
MHRYTFHWICTSLICVLPILACNKPPAVNPWRPEPVAAEKWQTPTSERILAADVKPAVRQKEHMPHQYVPQVAGEVPHYPLYWEDPFEDVGDQNEHFAWTWQDYVVMPYSMGRVLLNTVAVPVSMVVTPPWQTMVSDGYVGQGPYHLHEPSVENHPHDAWPAESPDPTATKADQVNANCTEDDHADEPAQTIDAP